VLLIVKVEADLHSGPGLLAG